MSTMLRKLLVAATDTWKGGEGERGKGRRGGEGRGGERKAREREERERGRMRKRERGRRRQSRERREETEKERGSGNIYKWCNPFVNYTAHLQAGTCSTELNGSQKGGPRPSELGQGREGSPSGLEQSGCVEDTVK